MKKEQGRHYVEINGRLFCIEPITKGKQTADWGDINPATGKVGGSYGKKYDAAVHPDNSIITEENGFKNIVTLEPGESPYSYIQKLIEEDKSCCNNCKEGDTEECKDFGAINFKTIFDNEKDK